MSWLAEDFLSLPKSFHTEFLAKIEKMAQKRESILLLAPPGMGKSTLAEIFWRRHVESNIDIITISLERPDVDITKAMVFSGKQTVVWVDHAEQLLEKWSNSVLLSLKSFREIARDKISFIFTSNVDLSRPENLERLKPIAPLLLENTLYIPLLPHDDAIIFLDRAAMLFEVKVPPKIKEEIVQITGGAPRLIKRLVKIYSDRHEIKSVLENPEEDPKIKLEMERVGKFLAENPNIKYNIPLLTTFGQPQKAAKPVSDTVEGITFYEPLTKQEYLLAKLLIIKAANLVTREEMIEAVWNNKMYDINEHALDQMIHRLRHKLDTATPKCLLETLRGRGCRLTIV